ncbi:hypothetical protein [Cecembia calidifontis]|nr:hypothetical protein [Cecembia calidifontis]
MEEGAVAADVCLNMKKKEILFSTLLGILLLGMSWWSWNIEGKGTFSFQVLSIPFGIFGLLMILNPFKPFLEKYKITKGLYLFLELTGAIVFILLYASTIFLKVMFSMIIPMMVLTALGAKTLEFFGLNNAIEIAYFNSFTLTAIVFSFKGNVLIKKIIRIFGGSKETRERELPIIQWLLSQEQIKYGIYVLYCILLILSTNLELINGFNEDESQKMMALTLQSFAVFLAFEILIEKRYLLKPYSEFIEKLKDGFKEAKGKPADEINKEDKKEK